MKMRPHGKRKKKAPAASNEVGDVAKDRPFYLSSRGNCTKQ